MYLTVLGTSAEAADGGQVGRGNRASGLITFGRPMSLEAIAGKNPVSHVGKIYSLLAQQIAQRVYASTDALEEVYIWLCSRIGSPVDVPWFASARVALAQDATIEDVQGVITRICHEELQDVPTFSERLTRGELPVCRRAARRPAHRPAFYRWQNGALLRIRIGNCAYAGGLSAKLSEDVIEHLVVQGISSRQQLT